MREQEIFPAVRQHEGARNLSPTILLSDSMREQEIFPPHFMFVFVSHRFGESLLNCQVGGPPVNPSSGRFSAIQGLDSCGRELFLLLFVGRISEPAHSHILPRRRFFHSCIPVAQQGRVDRAIPHGNKVEVRTQMSWHYLLRGTIFYVALSSTCILHLLHITLQNTV